MDELKIVRRKGWEGKCPGCGEARCWTKFNVMDAVTPHLYCDQNNDILWRKSDQSRLLQLVEANGRREPELAALKTLWTEMEASAPECICGGRFSLAASLRCHRCRKVLLQPTLEQQIYANWIFAMDGVAVIGDALSDSYRVEIDV